MAFLRVPKQLSDLLIRVDSGGGPFECKKCTFLKTLHQEMYQKKHDEFSWNFACAHVIHARVFNGGATACGAVLT